MKYLDVFTYIKRKHVEEHKTPVFARNLGIKLTETKYIGFLDADDELCEGFIDRACTFLDNHPKYNGYYNKHIIKDIGANGNIVTQVPLCDVDVNEVDFVTFILKNGMTIHFCAGVYKTDLIQDCLFTDVICEDSVFQLKYCYKHEPLYFDLKYSDSIIYNKKYSESKNWIRKKTDYPRNYEMYMEIEKEIPDIKYSFYLQENGKVGGIIKNNV